MRYTFFSQNPTNHFIDIRVELFKNTQEYLEVQLPAWRPGRYELQNFAKNLREFHAFSGDGNRLPCRKITKDRWLVQADGQETIRFEYSYYAQEINAGSSFLDTDIFYVNPVNCCIYVEGRQNEPCEVVLTAQPDQQLACGLAQKRKGDTIQLFADDFAHLADSPWILSNTLQKQSYTVQNTQFHVWFEGNIYPNWEKLLPDFQKFTEEQIRIFGEFPENDFHFITWITPFPCYHGVEHRNSTMMVLGPDSQSFDQHYWDLLGLSSHELFHAWNVCKIRPKELLPYDFTKENYFETCFVVEGVTTYYGDYLLWKSGVMTDEQYKKELETCYRRHFETAKNARQSLRESSFDLWLDGYQKGIPDRKVSVYFKGAIAAQILDYQIRQKTNNVNSLDDVMRKMWVQFGKRQVGYTYQDYKNLVCEFLGGEATEAYFSLCIDGIENVWEETKQMVLTEKKWVLQETNGIVTLT
ncbi:MAG: M61 family metallopeptidase [Spirosomataceae bacterium]